MKIRSAGTCVKVSPFVQTAPAKRKKKLCPLCHKAFFGTVCQRYCSKCRNKIVAVGRHFKPHRVAMGRAEVRDHASAGE